MQDEKRTKRELIEELEVLRKKVVKLQRSESGRRQAEERFRSLFDEAPVGYHELDREGRVTRVNETESKMLGYRPEEMVGQLIWNYTAEPEKVKEIFGAKMSGELTPGQAFERVYRRKDGSPLIVIAEDRLLRDKTGAIVGIRTTIQDITERKRAEEALRQNENRYRTFFKTSRDCVFITSTSGEWIDMNDAAVELFGYSSRDDLMRVKISDLYAKAEDRREHIRIIAEQGYTKDYPVDLRRKDGGIIHTLITSAARYDADGNVIGFMGTIKDITEIKRSEEWHRMILKTAMDGFWLSGPGGRLLEVNESYCRMSGYSEPELLAMRISDLEVVETVGDVETHILKITEQGQDQFESRHRRKDGSVMDVEVCAQYQPSEGGRRCVAFLRDITKRKRAEEALRHSEEQATQLARENAIMAEIGRIISSTLNIDEVYDLFAREVWKLIPFDRIVIGMIDSQKMTGVSTYASGRAGLGVPPGVSYSLEGTGIGEMVRTKRSLLVQPENLEDLRERFPKLLPILQAGGFRSMMCAPLYAKGEIIGGLILQSARRNAYALRDLGLAERIGAQIAGAIANAQLIIEQQRLEDRLRRAEKMEALGTLAGGVAHDLNNVLGVLVGYSELLLMKLEQESPLKGHVSNILQAGQRAAAIIQDLLTLARRGVPVSAVVNLNSLISDCFQTPEFEKLKSFPMVAFKTRLDKDLLNIKGSPVHLSKTIINLLNNAAEAITDQGEITIETENRYLDKPIAGYDHIREGDYVVLKVSDNGRGISPVDIGKIFEPFYTKKVMGRSGTGLGLAVVWGTVKDHGGYIDVQSEVGKGSAFTLYFPVTRERRVTEEKAVSAESYRGRGESILVVDDVKEQRELATAMLGELGYQVSAVASGEEAVTYLKTHRVDLLVLDMIMDPGMDGLDTYEKVLEISSKQKAVIVSGFSETERVKKAQQLGAGTYVRKPYIMEKIGLAIRTEIDK